MRLGTTLFPAPPGVTPLEGLHGSIARARQLRVQVLNGSFPPQATADDLARARERWEAAGLEFEPICGASYCSAGAEARQVCDRVVAALQTAQRLGCRRLRTMANRAINRFTKQPPPDEQLDMIEANLRVVAAAAEDLGVTMAIENHCDYRGYEIAELIRRVGSPRLGAALDAANGFTSFEDPMDAARALARYAITTHLKDFRIDALGIQGKAPWIPVGCALGEGNVDIPAVVELLARHAPDPASLPLVVEVNWPREGEDAGALLVQSVKYVRERLGSYLS